MTTPALAQVSPDAKVHHDLMSTLQRMKAAQRRSGSPSYDERIRSLEKLEHALLSRKETIAAAISRDFGHRSRHETLMSDIFLTIGAIKHIKAHLRRWMAPERRKIHFVFLPSRVEIVRQPLGVVGIIAPWNYPAELVFKPLVPVLAAGNRAMIKPSELVPETAALLRDIVAETFPADQVTVVTGGTDVGEAFSRLPFDHLLFTGSTRVGKAIMRAASDNLVPVTLELGGKSPAIIGADFDPRVAADRIMAGKLFNGGQTCIAPDYVMLPSGKRDAFVEACLASVAKMYPSFANNPDYTSIVNERHRARLEGYLKDATAHGARVIDLNPGLESLHRGETRKMVPSLVLEPTDEMLVMQEEIFGPILPVLTYDNLDQAIDYVNDHARPLALYYFDYNKRAIERVLSETVSGGVTINETMLHGTQEDLPFGGVGASGMGQFHAKEGFDQFTKKKSVFRQSRLNTRSLLRPPYGNLIDRVIKTLLS